MDNIKSNFAELAKNEGGIIEHFYHGSIKNSETGSFKIRSV